MALMELVSAWYIGFTFAVLAEALKVALWLVGVAVIPFPLAFPSR